MDKGTVQAFRRDGYVVLPGFLTGAEVGALTRAIVDAPERDPEPNPLSLDAMRFASNLLYGSPELQAFLASERVVDVACDLAGPDLWVRWDQAVWKGPGAPRFPWHQDNGYTRLAVEHLQLWVALTDMDRSNGGLSVVPGGHAVPLPHHWVGSHVETDPPGLPPGRAVDLDATAGDIVLFSSWLPHATTANQRSTTRLAYVAEYLRLRDADTGVAPPHFVAARAGAPAPGFEDLAPTWTPRSESHQ